MSIITHIDDLVAAIKSNKSYREDLDISQIYDTWDYNEEKFIRGKAQITITCPIHGDTTMTRGQLDKRYLCSKCHKDQNNGPAWLHEELFKRHGVEQNLSFIEESYDYNLGKWINNKVKVICPDHGPSMRYKHDALKSLRCRQCQAETLSEFIINGIEQGTLHDNFIKSSKAPMPRFNIVHSKAEVEWLDSFDNPNILRSEIVHLSDGSNIRPDGVDYTTKTIYEFWGSFWHGDPRIIEDMSELCPKTNQTFLHQYIKTMEKIRRIRRDGWNLVDIWELDWYLENPDRYDNWLTRRWRKIYQNG